MFNKFMVGIRGDEIVILGKIPAVLSREEALCLAAYLVALAADDIEKDWQPVLKEVMES